MVPWTFSRYLVIALVTVLALLSATALITVAVDPYRVFATRPVPGWTMMKPFIYQRDAVAKTYQLERIAPETLLLGNSRIEVGIDPASDIGLQPCGRSSTERKPAPDWGQHSKCSATQSPSARQPRLFWGWTSLIFCNHRPARTRRRGRRTPMNVDSSSMNMATQTRFGLFRSGRISSPRRHNRCSCR